MRSYVDWHVAAAAAPAPVAAVPARRRLAVPRPSRETVVRDASLAVVGGTAGTTIGLAAHFHTLDDKPTFIALLALVGDRDDAARARSTGRAA